MSGEVRSFTGKSADWLNRKGFSKPDSNYQIRNKYGNQLEKTHTFGRKLIRGIGRFFLSVGITHIAAPIGAVYHLSSAAISYHKASSLKGDEKKKYLEKADAHSKAFAIDGGVTAALAISYATLGTAAAFAGLGLTIIEMAYTLAPNRFAHITGENMNSEDKNSSESYIGYNTRFADEIFYDEGTHQPAV